MGRKPLVKLFNELPPPDVESMDGEFRATLLDQGYWINNLVMLMAFNVPGVWIAKAFRPQTSERGEGYNAFRIGEHKRPRYRMDTYIAASQFDGRMSYHLDYRKRNRWNLAAWSNLKGEVRQLGPSLFLGLGTADFRLKSVRRACPFMLEGPTAEYSQGEDLDGAILSAHGASGVVPRSLRSEAA